VGGAVYGGVSGANKAVSDDKATQIEARLRALVAEMGRPEALQSEIVTTASKSGIKGISKIASDKLTVSGEALDYPLLSSDGIDTVLELGPVSVGLIGQGGEDPMLALRASALIRVVDVKTNTEVYGIHSFSFAGAPRKLSELIADDERLFKEELSNAYRSIAQSIVDEVFFVVRTN
jgi:hypothetical protein